MEQIGVEAVVNGLTSFLSAMGTMDDSIKGVGVSGGILSSVFKGLGDVASWLANSAMRILEYTLGNLLASAIQTAIRWIQELIQGTIEAGNEFQALSIRLQNFNMNDATKSISNYDIAMQVATKATQEQLTWLQKLATQSPYDATDIANVYSLARSYGFADNQSRGLTKTIAEFASGMGLGNQEIERIIVNLGQMQQQGKVTQREMTDLARGALVPVNDVLALMEQQSGLTGAAFDEFRNSGEGVQAFMKAFSTLVEQRFSGSMEKMSRTWKGATDNLKDFVKNSIGLNVIAPILDVIGGKVADFVSALSEGDTFESFKNVAFSIADSLSQIITNILGLGNVSIDEFVNAIIVKLWEFAHWLFEHKGDIVDFVQNVITNVGEFATSVSNFIQTVIVPAFNRISEWVNQNSGKIEEFFGALGEIISEVFSNLFGGVDTGGTDFLGSLLEGVSKFMQFVIDNKDAIADWATLIIQAAAAFAVFQLAVSITLNIIFKLISFVAGAAALFFSLYNIVVFLGPVFTFLGSAIAAVGTFLAGLTLPMWALIAAVIALVAIVVINWDTLKTITYQLYVIITYYMKSMWEQISTTFRQLSVIVGFYVMQAWNSVVSAFNGMVSSTTSGTASILSTVVSGFTSILAAIITKMVSIYNTVVNAFNNVKSALQSISWSDVGTGIINGIISGIKSMVGALVNAAVAAANAAMSAVKSTLKISSPSKVMYDVGQNIMLGMADGILATTGIVESAMQSASFKMVASGISASQVPSTSISNISNANYNLAIHTNASSEPIIQDFAMMKSLSL